MHQYKIEIFAYNPNGSVGELFATRYADNPEQARLICAEYVNQYQLDAEGNRTNNKMHRVNLHILCYKLCTDKDAFFAQFQA